MNELFLKVGIVVCLALGGIASSVLFKLKKDNKIEEYAERLIADRTGFLIDLSPQDGFDPDDKVDE